MFDRWGYLGEAKIAAWDSRNFCAPASSWWVEGSWNLLGLGRWHRIFLSLIKCNYIEFTAPHTLISLCLGHNSELLASKLLHLLLHEIISSRIPSRIYFYID